MVELHFSIIPSYTDEKAEDPILVLQGGPGVSALDNMYYWIQILGKSLTFRDLIVLEQRGTG